MSKEDPFTNTERELIGKDVNISDDHQDDPTQEPIGDPNKYPSITMTNTVPDELQKELDDLDAAFSDGEIDVIGYMKQRSAVYRQIIFYQISEANRQTAYYVWIDAQNNFMINNSHYADNKVLFDALVSAVKQVQEDVRSKWLSPAQVFSAADYLLRDTLGIVRDAAVNDRRRETRPKGLSRDQILKALQTADGLVRDSFDKEDVVDTQDVKSMI